MKKSLVCASLLSLLISTSAVASEVDLSSMSLDELVALKNSITEEIDSRDSVTDTEAVTEVADNVYISSEGLEFESNGDGTCSIVGIGTCTDTSLVIPNESPEGDIVTLIDENAFMGLDDVESVTLIDAAYEVDKYAFQYGKFTELNIIGGSPVIKKSAFSTCEKLKNVLIKDCEISAGENAFLGCGKDASISIDNCKGTIGKYAFQYGEIVNLTISRSDLEIEKSAFSSCEDLTSIVFSDSTITTEENAFFGCGDEANVEIIDSTVTVGDSAFQYGEILTLSIYNSDVAIEKRAFSTCEGLTSIVFSDSAITTEENAFFGCGDTGIIEITNCAVTLGKCAFQYSSIGSITITGSKAEIGEHSFSNCEDLGEVVIDCESIFLDESAFSSCDDLISVSLCLNEKTDNTIEIEERAFNYCKNLETFSIGNGAVKLGKNVFSGCDKELSVSIGGEMYGVKDLEKGMKL